MNARILAVANQKGGVGKTTTAINLATALAVAGQKQVLLVDLDPQANLTSGVGLKGQAPPDRTVYHAITADVADAHALRAADTRPSPEPDPGGPEPHRSRSRTGAACPSVKPGCARCSTRSATSFDYIFIDTPPSLGLLTLNALVAADAVLIPLNCEYFALEGLADLVATLRRVRASLNPALDIAGVLMTMYDERTNLGQQVARDIRAFFQDRVYTTVIPRNIRLGEAPSHGVPAARLRCASRAAPRPTSRWRAKCSAAKARRPRSRSSNMAEKRPALGRGLSALIPDAPPAPPASVERSLDVDIDLLRPNKFQPRTHMDDARIEDLSRSIKSNGVIQPIVVRQTDSGYEIVAGERRWRASQRAGLLKVPVVVRDIPEERLLAAALIENIQREDLNPIEEAQAYRRLADEFSAHAGANRRMRSARIARQSRTTCDCSSCPRRSAITSRRDAVDGPCPRAARPAGRSRAAAPRQGHRRRDALGARDRGTGQAPIDPPPAKPETQKDVHTRAAEERLRFSLGTRVRIIRKGKGGRIEDRFRGRERAASHLRTADRKGIRRVDEETDRVFALRRLSEQTRRW